MVRWTWRGGMAALQDGGGAGASSAAVGLAVASCGCAVDLARPLYRPCLRQRVPAVERASPNFAAHDAPPTYDAAAVPAPVVGRRADARAAEVWPSRGAAYEATPVCPPPDCCGCT